MILKGPGGFGRIVNCIMNIIMCLLLSLYVLWTVQNIPGNEALPILTPLALLVEFVKSFAVGMFIGDFIPALGWGQKLAGALKLKGVAAYFVSVAVLCFVMVTCISFICTWIANVQTAGMAGVWASWLMVYPVLLGGGYIVQLISLKPAMKAAAAISGFDPAAAPPAPAPEA